MYSLSAYGLMVADRARVEAYAQALRKTVRPRSVVAEVGTGPGIFAVLACQLGAGCVYAIEPSEIIQVAREVAAANGCAAKIEFLEDVSERITLPRRADIVLSDLRGVLPLFQRHIPTIVDARKRFLAPGGTLVPRSDSLRAAIVEAPKPYGEIVSPWEQNPLGLELNSARNLAVNNIQKVRVGANQLLTEPREWATLDYYTIESPDVRSSLEWKTEQAGIGHGILTWFDADLAEGVGFTNAPGAPETIYGSLFFPWTRPVSLARGQAVCVSLEAKLIENDYVWRWTTQIEAPSGSDASAIHFEQSQLGGAMLSAIQLHKRAADYVPHLSEDGRVRSRTLELMDGILSLEEIARRLAKEFPQRFPEWRQALSYAGAVSQEYSR